MWISSDPLREQFPNVSSYVYCHDNPIRFIDPTGMADGEPETNYQLPKDPKNIDTNIWEEYKPEKHTGHSEYWRNKTNGSILAYDKDGGHYHLYKDTRFKIRIDAEGTLSETKLPNGVKISKGNPRFHLKGGAKINLTKINQVLKNSNFVFGLSIIGDLLRIATNHPDGLFNSFNPDGKLNTCYGMPDPDNIGNRTLYYEMVNKSKDGGVIDVILYQNYYYDYDSGRYRGMGEYMEGTMRKEKGGYRMSSPTI